MRPAACLPVLLLLCGLDVLAQPFAPCPSGQLALRAGTTRVCAEIAQTEPQRELGLMHRAALPPDGGMLFVFPQPDVQRFWMKNTELALSIAFLDDNGKIVNIEDMRPQTLDPHASARPVRYALEMRQGWFSDHRLKAGSQFQGLPPTTDAH